MAQGLDCGEQAAGVVQPAVQPGLVHQRRPLHEDGIPLDQRHGQATACQHPGGIGPEQPSAHHHPIEVHRG